MDRTINNPGYLDANASNEVNEVNEIDYIYNRSAYEAQPNIYNKLSRKEYSTLQKERGTIVNRNSSEY